MNAARTLSQHPSRKASRAGSIRRRSLYLALLCGLTHAASAWAAAPADASPGGIDFDSAFFNGTGGDDHVDLSRFDRGPVVLPGLYTVDVTVNDSRWQGQESFTFRVPKDQPDANAVPCFTHDMLETWGVNLAKVQQDRAQQAGSKTPAAMPAGLVCAPLSTLVPDAKADFDVSALSMHISIPQLYMNRRHGNWVDPSQWQDGVDAGFADYSFSADTNRSRKMENYIYIRQRLTNRLRGSHVADYQFHVARKVIRNAVSVNLRCQAIQHAHRVPRLQQTIRKVRANKSRAARNQNLLAHEIATSFAVG